MRISQPAMFLFFIQYCLCLFFSPAHSSPKDPEECRIKATIAQDTNVIYDLDLTPQQEALVVGPEYYNLSEVQKEDVIQAYNCLMIANRSRKSEECYNFSLKDYKTNQRVASFFNCRLIPE